MTTGYCVACGALDDLNQADLCGFCACSFCGEEHVGEPCPDEVDYYEAYGEEE